ncbi:putative N-acetyltransferase YafP [Novipirellula galeiformis]|uniref:Putative N-acetyltransferase YafP n=1 Tax=Novipirellula galeiformis TaxID=2528004 RepID=A0A5C6CM87_9BACT|nr:GNAT family N-acetyltransferase [Novipirellula galeiformis]TWU25185.1 putative N-acetyltransferase YafP [Novipirellula galeiformis]
MGANRSVSIRAFVSSDSDECLHLFRDTIHRVNLRDYSPEQINAWAPPDVDLLTWARRFEDRFAYVACQAKIIVGFIDMTRLGHLDRLYVSADHQRQGIARGLVERVLRDAEQQGCQCVRTEASITAKPFFESMGFAVIKQQQVECRGVMLTNFQMRFSRRA